MMYKRKGGSREDLLALTLPIAAPAAATALALLVLPWVAVANLAFLYLLAVLITAVTTRIKPALACAAVSFFAYNYFLTQPRYSLEMLHHEDVLTAIIFVAVALVTGHLAARLSEQVAALRASERWSNQQMDCARALSGCVEGEEIIASFAEQLASALGWHARVLPAEELNREPPGNARGVCCKEDESGATILFTDASGKASGAIRLSASERLTPWHRERLDTLTSLATLAWGRVQLADSLRRETLDKEREQLRSALLSSVSHDLRTPLSTMIGSVSSLIDLSDSLGEADRAELLSNTLSEARRLDRYIQKLLDMTRLGHGELTLDRDWIGIDDIVSVMIRRAQPMKGSLNLSVDLPANLPLLHVHPALIEQALFNVLENAIRFSPPNGAIALRAAIDGAWLDVDVQDSGPGISPADRERVFDMFHTFSHGDTYAAGTGLGLAICRSIVAAHGGQVAVVDTPGAAGATIRLRLPVPDSANAISGSDDDTYSDR